MTSVLTFLDESGFCQVASWGIRMSDPQELQLYSELQSSLSDATKGKKNSEK